MPRQYSLEFRDFVLSLVEQGRGVGKLAGELGIFSATMQVKLLNQKRCPTRLKLANAMFEYIEVYYTVTAATQP